MFPFLLLGLFIGVTFPFDALDHEGEFDFIYHEQHSLLLTIHNGTCYYSTIPERAKWLMPGERRKFIEGNAAQIIISQDRSKLSHTTIERMRDVYQDLLANFRCTANEIYTLELFLPDKMSCDFEGTFHPLCGYTQDNNDDFDWTRRNGSTPTAGTGPIADHTYGDDSGHYLYVESSEPRRVNETARLTSEVFTADAGSPHCLRFSYNMHGSAMGSLNVYVTQTSSQSVTPIWSRTGTQGDQWKDAEIDLAPTGDFQVIFEGVMGEGFLSDIAIDDIIVSRESCNPPISCDFESWSDPACGFKQDTTDSFNWTLGRGPTSTRGTGPSADHSYGADGLTLGHYMYIETSEPRLPNDTARIAKLVSVSTNSSERCISFFYHMFGDDMGTLNVYVTNMTSLSRLPSPTWSQSGNQGDAWKEGHITITESQGFQLVFEGIHGPTYGPTGDIAIDDITISDGKCEDRVTTTTTTTTTTAATTTAATTTSLPTTTTSDGAQTTVTGSLTRTTSTASQPSASYAPVTSAGSTADPNCLSGTSGASSPFHLECYFDHYHWCNFIKDETTDDFDWQHGNGYWPANPFTGPSRDHSGLVGGGYLFIDSSSHRVNDKARLISHVFSSQDWTDHCLRFQYHMHGRDIGRLNVYAVDQHSLHPLPSPVWSVSGDQGNAWHGAEIKITLPRGFVVVIEGVVGNGPYGNIAIDDVFMSRDQCCGAQPMVVSESPRPNQWSLRLAGQTQTAGRLEVYLDGKWGSVCDEGFRTSEEARVACRVLGFSSGTATVLPRGTFPQPDNVNFILASDIHCRGDEATIADCQLRGLRSDTCVHGEDVAISCGAGCTVGLALYKDGESWTSWGGCQTCSCHDGQQSCVDKFPCPELHVHPGCREQPPPPGQCCKFEFCPTFG